jgi:tRNA A-37 threonylcarbamoyl transferase component Bud32
VSRSEREAVTLQRLEAAGLPGPQWLAYGADGVGRAFLIVDELAGAADLRLVLGDAGLSLDDRRALAERAGRAVAELHEAGFGTPELAAKHLFVNRDTLAVTLLDWQSAGLPGPVPDRVRQLAGLHASLADDLADVRTRLRFLWAYLRVVRRGRQENRPALRFGRFARTVQAAADRIRERSSVRDQRPAVSAQRLVWLAGETVCVIPEVVPFWPTPATAAPFYPDGVAPLTPQEWVTFPDGRRALLIRFCTSDPVGRLAAVVREKPWRSPAARAARVLFHLERHGVPGPKLLAFGQRPTSAAVAESFVLYEPPVGAVPAAVRVAQLPPAERRDLLAGCGRLLRSLHDAGCRPTRSDWLTERPAVESPTAVRLGRRVSGSARRADLRRLVRATLPGLSRADRYRVVRGYVGDDPAAARAAFSRIQ